MTWQHQRMPAHAQLLPPPEDGIALSSHPPGWLGSRWRALLDTVGKEAQDRVLRGRNFARRGRLRLLTVSPGSASAECVCEEAYHPTLRVRPFSRQEWSAILHELTEDLNLIASLLEGELPKELVARLESRGIQLLPTLEELGFDCDCGDYVMPCTHVSTVFHTLTDVLDGEPFLLLTLRGRDREHLLATLRSDWGDAAPLAEALEQVDEPVPDGDWFTSPVPLPEFGCQFPSDAPVAAGLRALGPPPGEGDLVATLRPIYEAGAVKVREVLDAIPDRPAKRRPRLPEPRAAEPAPTEPTAPSAPPASVGGGLTEALVELLADDPGLGSTELAERLGTTVSSVREELVAMEDLGLVLRETDGESVRWYLG